MLNVDLKTRLPPPERPDKETCGICKRQISRYTCPSCNVPYCSLVCFRSEKHSECSETFYRKEIERDIHRSPRSAEDRRRMMNILQSFEEESSQEQLSEADEEDLAQKLEGIDLDTADPNSLWKVLSPAQRDTFFKAMRDPSSVLAQELLSSPELAAERRKPWWESPSVNLDDHSEAENEFGALPTMLSIPQTLKTTETHTRVTNSLVHNVLALCLAYAYVTRRLSVSPLCSLGSNNPDRTVALDLLSQIVPFLIDRKSRVLFKTVESVITDVWSRLEALSDPPSRESFSLLLADAARLIRPQRVAVIEEGKLQSHQSRVALLVISDIVGLFSGSSKFRHVVHKLNFYAAHLCDQNTDLLRLTADEIRIAGLEMQTQPPV